MPWELGGTILGGAGGFLVGGPAGAAAGAATGRTLGGAAGNYFSGNNTNNLPEIPELQRMDWGEAYRQAQKSLDPGFERHLSDTLDQVDRQSRARGFYGQLPAAVTRRATAGDLAMQHQANLAQHAAGVQQRDLQAQQAAAQLALQQHQLGLQRDQMGAQQTGQMWQGLGQLAGTAAPYIYDYFTGQGGGGTRPIDATTYAG